MSSEAQPLPPKKQYESSRRAKAKYRETHREQLREKKAAYNEAHRDERLAKSRQYYADNRDAILARIDPEANRARVKQWRLDDPERARKSKAASYAKNRESILAQIAEYRKNNTEVIKARKAAAYLRDYEKDKPRYKANAHRRRARMRNAPINDLTPKQWQEIQEQYGHRCVYCGKKFKGHLTPDHLTPYAQRGSNTAQNVVPSCLACNIKKNAGPVLKPVQPVLLLINEPKPHTPRGAQAP